MSYLFRDLELADTGHFLHIRGKAKVGDILLYRKEHIKGRKKDHWFICQDVGHELMKTQLIKEEDVPKEIKTLLLLLN